MNHYSFDGLDLSERFNVIRRAWSEFEPILRKEKGPHDPYFCDWLQIFTPIESSVWSDIRSTGLPLYPQYPACGFFLDFACPLKKIAIECDGKEWHDPIKDAARDAILEKSGWIVIRIPGSKCMNMSDHPIRMDFDCNSDYEEEYMKWLENTSEGVVISLKYRYFAEIGIPKMGMHIYENILRTHQTTRRELLDQR